MPYSISKEKCEGCDACRVACPTQAIRGEQYKKHSIDPDLCASCGLCADFCEHGAIFDNFGNPAPFCSWEDWKLPKVNTELCTGCSLCVENCPMYVLKISDAQFRGDIRTHAYVTDPDLCIGCEKCQKRCPLGAITMVERE